MLFQVIDNKGFCESIYRENKIIKNPTWMSLFPLQTWDYHPSLSGLDVQYASLYCRGKSLDEVCPDELKEQWEEVKEKHKAYIRSFHEAKVATLEHCFYDLVPESFLKEYFGVREQIIKSVFENYEKPYDYDHLVSMSEIIYEISQRQLKLNLVSLRRQQFKPRAKALLKKLTHDHFAFNRIRYNLFGTITGRLTCKRNSFNILTLDKKYKNIIQPTNDFFLELDFNSAELRAMLALNEQEQPKIDLHEWHKKEFNRVYGDNAITRDKVKERIFAWLYSGKNSTIGIKAIDDAYNRSNILNKYWNGKQIQNPYGRRIDADAHHAFNFIIQSFTSDLFQRQAVKIWKKLYRKKTCIAYMIHDSLVLDLAVEDLPLVKELVKIFSETEYGKFLTNVSIGKNAGEMRKIAI